MLHNGFQDDKYKPNKLLKRMVNDGELGVKTKKGFYDYKLGVKDKTINDRFL